MDKEKRISIALLMITTISTIGSWVALPDVVRVLHSSVADTTTYLPKVWAIILAAILSISGCVGMVISKKEEPQKYYPLTISVIGICLFIYILVVNCLI